MRVEPVKNSTVNRTFTKLLRVEAVKMARGIYSPRTEKNAVWLGSGVLLNF